MKTIGLMGGSFNPAHKGHRAISLFAMDSLGLDAYWWMVSPGNPLKPQSDMAPLPARMASAKAQAKRTPIKVTAIEQALDLHARGIECRQPDHQQNRVFADLHQA